MQDVLDLLKTTKSLLIVEGKEPFKKLEKAITSYYPKDLKKSYSGLMTLAIGDMVIIHITTSLEEFINRKLK